MNPSPSPFAELARRLRAIKGLSQAEVSRVGGLSRGYVSMMETGERGARPARDSVLRLAKGLLATPAERDALLDLAGYPTQENGAKSNESPSGLIEAIRADQLLDETAKQILTSIYLILRNNLPL